MLVYNHEVLTLRNRWDAAASLLYHPKATALTGNEAIFFEKKAKEGEKKKSGHGLLTDQPRTLSLRAERNQTVRAV